jgi:PadR family transcriptional regulator PadR
MPRSPRTDQLQGTFDLLILKTLGSRAPLHGYDIATHFQQVSAEVLCVEEGSLYPALHRIEGLGWISSEWSLSPSNRRAKVYSLTDDGRKRLTTEEQRWEEPISAVAKVLQCSGP